jgi:hypothetical protein
MGDKKHIDRIFQESFKDFEVVPDDAVWKNIKSKLDEKEDDDRLIPIWWRYAGIAALLLLFLTIGGLMFVKGSDTNSSIQVVDTENSIPINSDKEKASDVIKNPSNSNNGNDSTQDNVATTGVDVLEIESQENIVSHTSNKTNNQNKANSSLLKEAVLASNPSSNNPSIAENASSNQSIKNNSDLDNASNNSVTETSTTKQNKTSTKDLNQLQNSSPAIANKTSNSNSLNNKKELDSFNEINSTSSNETENENTIAESDINRDTTQENIMAIDSLTIEGEISSLEDIIEEEKTINRWRISPNVAPVYFNSLGDEGSSIDAQFDTNSKSSELNMSYGITGSYAINNKLVVRAGINQVKLGYNTNDILAFETTGRGPNSSLLSNINPDNSDTQMTLVSAESVVLSRASNVIDFDNVGSLNQRIGYIEIPVELQYSLLNKKFGVNVIGGFSSFFLNENELSSSIGGITTNIGEANNVNDISYSANFGIGVNYNVSEKIKVNLEPTFKYQINTFNNSSGDFQPYFIGVYTGLSYKF